MKLLFYSILCYHFVFPQDNMYVFIRKYDDPFTQFEKKIALNIVKLHNKSEKIKLKLNFIKAPVSLNLFQALEGEEYKNNSCAIIGLSITEKRKERFVFSIPYMPNRLAVLGKGKVEYQLTNLTKVGLILDASSAPFIKNFCIQNKIKTIPVVDIDDMNKKFDTNQINYIITDYVASFAFNLKPKYVIENGPKESYGIMFAKNSNLYVKLKKYMKYYLKSKVYVDMIRKDFGNSAVEYFKHHTQ